MGKPPKIARSARDMDVRLGGSLGGLSLGGGTNTTARRVMTRGQARSAANPQPALGLLNVEAFTGSSISEVVDVTGRVAIVTFTGAGTGPVDDEAFMTATASGRSGSVTVAPGLGNPILLVGGTGYTANATQIIGHMDGQPLGPVTVSCSLSSSPAGTYSFGVVVSW